MSVLSKKHSFDEVYDGQAVYRLVLEAVSNPTKIVNIHQYAAKLFGANPDFLALAITLLDSEVSFYANDNLKLSRDITLLTLASIESPEAADYIFIEDKEYIQDLIGIAKCGTLANPHKSATLIIQNEDLADCDLVFVGPGIDGSQQVSVSETVMTALRLRDKQHYEYPQGIDLFFVSENGDFFAVPRTTRWEVQ